MPVSHSGRRLRQKSEQVIQAGLATMARQRPRLVLSKPALGMSQTTACSVVDLGKSARVSLMLTPEVRGTFRDQAERTLSAMNGVLQQAPHKMTVTSQTVFLRDAANQANCEAILAEYYGEQAPLTSFVVQPPCSGAALALEAWAIGGQDLNVERFGPDALAVSYDGVRWVHCAGKSTGEAGAYLQITEALQAMEATLEKAGSDFGHVVRTWFCLGNITEIEGGPQRYMELNRARTDFYNKVRFCCSLPVPNIPHGIYPASTAI